MKSTDMARRTLMFLSLLGLSVQKPESSQTCRCFPGDSCWPGQHEWNEFNQTIGGRLIATEPIAKSCHADSISAYDAQKCEDLKSIWGFPDTHTESSSSIMAAFFANQSCDPFLPKDAPCTVGSYIQYAVNASGASDYRKTIEFTKKHNIRLVIRNTGHDYLGKSSGPGAVGIWTHNLKELAILDYKSKHYTGKAIKVAAGVQAGEALQAAHAQGLVVVTGNCATIGIAGGFSQGGGHSPLSSKFGLGADQVLEWEVVTGTGELVIASQTENSDLYWALSGGGGGTFGVVLSMTSKLYPDIPTVGANLTFMAVEGSQDKFEDVVETWISNVPKIVDRGAQTVWYAMGPMFLNIPTTAPGISKEELRELYQPTLSKLDSHKIQYVFHIDEFPTYLDMFKVYHGVQNTTEAQLGGRFIPRSLVESDPGAITKALQGIVGKGAIVAGVAVNAAPKPGTPDNAVNPAWRESVFNALLGTPWSYSDWDLNIANQKLITEVLVPELEKLTPGGGSYLNEANFQQPDWQQAFYGTNYERLREIKDKYDPEHIFYAITAVGSEYWSQKPDGRLCKTGTSEKQTGQGGKDEL